MKKWNDYPEFLEKYNDIIQGHIKKGIVEVVDDSSVVGERFHYLPHHAVITPKKSTTKVRVVYDGSAKVKKENLSFNKNLFLQTTFPS